VVDQIRADRGRADAISRDNRHCRKTNLPPRPLKGSRRAAAQGLGGIAGHLR
jgi:hypothetical protein